MHDRWKTEPIAPRWWPVIVGIANDQSIAWGCAKAPTPHSTAHAERIRALEAKCVKMEDDYRGVVSARDQMPPPVDSSLRS